MNKQTNEWMNNEEWMNDWINAKREKQWMNNKWMNEFMN